MAKKAKKKVAVKNPGKVIFDFTGWEDLNGEQFHKLKTNARYFYYDNLSSKDFEASFRKYLKNSKYSKEDISIITTAYMPSTIGVLCKLLEAGCPDYNEKENEYWQSLSGTTGDILPLSKYIDRRIDKMYKEGLDKKQDEVKEEEPTNVISIQDRMREQISPLLESFEGCLDDWFDGLLNEKDFDPYRQMQAFEPQIKPAHAKLILDYFSSMIAEAKEVLENKDEDIREAYGLFSAKQRKEFYSFYEKIEKACNMFIQSGKAQRKPRKLKQVSNEKLVSKMKYKLQDTEYSLVSVNPASIIGASELWVFNTKTRKIGQYFADEYEGPLSVKGSTIQGFDKAKSIQKTLRKPDEQLKEFQSANKVALRKYMDKIKTKDSLLTGRINGDTILLKVT